MDDTGFYYYGARYYDPAIGRFISPDNIVSNPANPQCFNRYSYCLNNPLKYIDESGHWPSLSTIVTAVVVAVVVTVVVFVAAPVVIPALAVAGGFVIGTAALSYPPICVLHQK